MDGLQPVLGAVAVAGTGLPDRIGEGSAMNPALHLGVALDGYGWHRQAWRATLAGQPSTESVFSGRYSSGFAATAERCLLGFLTIDDTLTPPPRRPASISPRPLARRR